jgi:hypothetical protein
MILDEVIAMFGDYHRMITKIKTLYQWNQNNIKGIGAQAESIAFLHYPVSNVSLFKDNEWNFSDERQARKDFHTQASGYKLIFEKYPCIPPFIIFEGKAAFLLAKTLPARELSGTKTTAKGLKTITLILYFEGWLKMLNEGFVVLNKEFSETTVLDNFQSLASIDVRDHKKMFNPSDIENHVAYNFTRFQAILNSPRIRESVLPEGFTLVNLKKIGFEKNTKSEQNQSNKNICMPDEVFESCVSSTALVVIDFLQKMGKQIEDTKTVKIFAEDKNITKELSLNLNEDLLLQYAAYRLGRAGYGHEYIRSSTGVVDLPTQRTVLTELKKLNDSRINIGALSKYIQLVKSSAIYLISQFTGMRRSEQMNLMVDCSTDVEFGIPVLKSRVKKHRSYEQSLFDDKWVCIPIMQDALCALRILSVITNNPFLLSGDSVVSPNQVPKSLSCATKFYKVALHNFSPETDIPFHGYTLRNTLAYQLFKADLGLPFISHQLKHFSNIVTNGFGSGSNKGFAEVTLGYGDIGDRLSGNSEFRESMRKRAEIHAIKASYDPDANYGGVNGAVHKEKMSTLFEGYLASGYTKDEVFNAMAEQGMAIVNVGSGMCYGGKVEDFDESLPCIGGLRCNPVRCSNAVVTELHIPKWKEIYMDNMIVVKMGENATGYEQALEATKEAKMLLAHLGHKV